MYPEHSSNILPEPGPELKRISEELSQLIRAKIETDGPLSFSTFMEMALYQPGLGYYSAGLEKFGESGDFVTAPQLGNIFARCLATQVEQVASTLNEAGQSEYEIMEAGAGSGILAADLLSALDGTFPPARYNILERSAHLRQVQKETLREKVPQWMDRIQWLNEPPRNHWRGVFLANEVLDALTFDRFEINDEGISELKVACGQNGFEWQASAASDALLERVTAIVSSLDEQPASGYRSELNLHLPAWLDAVTASLETGVALLIDYGYTRSAYYHPQRIDGTLICHYRHRAHDDPFLWPGLTDISSSVDFTALAEAADACGLTVCGYTTQAMFLMACGLDGIIAGTAQLPETARIDINRQVCRLTLPGEMGERFQLMALARGLEEDVCDSLVAFSLADYCHRL
jgi:SAM-dependent MidA family methyltransferase